MATSGNSRTTPSRRASGSSSTSDAAGSVDALRVELSARADGSVVLRCTRPDGTVTWQTQQPPNARFFPFHDLTHFAVETTLGLRRGFFGLIADGWDIADTGGKGARGPIPREAVLVEHLVGLFDRERDGATPRFTAAELHEQLVMRAREGGFPLPEPALSEEALRAVRSRIGELHRAWRETAAGETLVLEYDLPAVSH